MIGAVIQGLASGTVYALMAVGLILVFKGSRVLNIAQGEIGALSFMGMLSIWRRVGLVPEDDVFATSFIAGVTLLFATVVVSAALGILVERTIMRRLVDRPAVQGTIATLGLAVVLINAELLGAKLLLPPSVSSYPINAPATVGGGSIGVLGANVATSLIVAAVVTGAVGFGLAFFFKQTKFGLGVVAATSDNTVARILGIPVTKVYRFTWGIGGALSGLAAALIPAGLQANLIKPGDMTLVLIIALAAAVVGGLDNIWGGIVGGLLVGVVRQVAQFQFPGLSGVEDLAILVLVVGTLMVRPRGVLGGAGAEVA